MHNKICSMVHTCILINMTLNRALLCCWSEHEVHSLVISPTLPFLFPHRRQTGMNSTRHGLKTAPSLCPVWGVLGAGFPFLIDIVWGKNIGI